ncbi:ABC-2 family transporter protein [Verrucomicrobia bacterium]|nr:ABC-2 family transporter protein [Verrucomicrobiota bacterium]
MSKYWHVINIGIQNTLVYRLNYFTKAGILLIPLMAVILLWKKIYEGSDTGVIGGFTLGHMISYYLVVTIVDSLTGVAEDDWQIAGEIRDGQISQFLLKPVDYLRYRLCLFAAGRVVYTMAAVIPVGAFILYQAEFFVLPKDGQTVVLFGCSIFLAALLQFFISYTMALMAFWVLEVSTLIFILFAFEYIAGGHMFPLAILPDSIQTILSFTPFPYQMYFPASIYLGQISGPELVQGFCIQLAWVVTCYGLARFVWSKGIRKYESVGG